MNTLNNARKKESQEKIKKAFIEMIQTRDINKISVMEIIKSAKVNRSTFYANYLDIYDLADKIKDEMFQNILSLYQDEAIKGTHSYDYLKLFTHIKENQIYYNTLFKLNFDFSEYYDINMEEQEAMKYLGSTEDIDYHIEFFKAGMNAIIKKWLNTGCKESPEKLVKIIKSEYQGRRK